MIGTGNGVLRNIEQPIVAQNPINTSTGLVGNSSQNSANGYSNYGAL